MSDVIGQVFSALGTILIVVIVISGWMWFKAKRKIKRIDETRFSEEYHYYLTKIKIRKIICLFSLVIFIVLCIILGSILGISGKDLNTNE